MYPAPSDQTAPSKFQQEGWRDSHALAQLLPVFARVAACAVNVIGLPPYLPLYEWLGDVRIRDGPPEGTAARRGRHRGHRPPLHLLTGGLTPPVRSEYTPTCHPAGARTCSTRHASRPPRLHAAPSQCATLLALGHARHDTHTSTEAASHPWFRPSSAPVHPKKPCLSSSAPSASEDQKDRTHRPARDHTSGLPCRVSRAALFRLCGYARERNSFALLKRK